MSVHNNRRLIFFFLLLSFPLSTAFADYRIPSEHAPSSSIEGAGDISIGNFKYIPTGLIFKEDKYCNNFKENQGAELDLNDINSFGPSSQNVTYYCVGNNEIVENRNSILKSSRIRFDNSISEYFKKALHNELKFMGFKIIKNANLIVDGAIEKFWIDYSSSNTNRIIFEILVKIKNSNGKELYRNNSIGEFLYTDGEHIDIPNSVYTSVSRAIENFVLTAQSAGILGYIEP
ncbi:MAG: hypothetical protein WDA20_02105 [Desulfuromonadales bacterium]